MRRRTIAVILVILLLLGGMYYYTVSADPGIENPWHPEEDTDGDGVADDVDNCPNTYNPNQLDSDSDGVGDACDSGQPPVEVDNDNDGIPDAEDNCPSVYNPSQTDSDNDGIGDACDTVEPTDSDNDGIPDEDDNCPYTYNPNQADVDNDGLGDVCDSTNNNDWDNDGISNYQDNCPQHYNPSQADSDNDGVGDACDDVYDPPTKPSDFQGWWKQQIRIEYVDGTSELVGATSDTSLTISRFGKEIANFVYILKGKVEPNGGFEAIALVLADMKVCFNDNGYITKRQIADPFNVDFRDYMLPDDGQWHTLVEKYLGITFQTGGDIQVYSEGGSITISPGEDTQTPFYVINAMYSGSMKYYPALPASFSFEIDDMIPNEDIAHAYNDNWNSPTGVSTNGGFQSFVISDIPLGDSIKLTRIRIHGNNHDYGTYPTCNYITLSVYGYYPNGLPNGFPYPAPPLPSPIASRTASGMTASTDGEWVEFDFSDANIMIPANQRWSYRIYTDSGYYWASTYIGDWGYDAYPEGMQASYSPDMPSGELYYDYNTHRDYAFQVFGILL